MTIKFLNEKRNSKSFINHDTVLCNEITINVGVNPAKYSQLVVSNQPHFFEISENFCTPFKNILQSLRNRMVKTVFENSSSFCHWKSLVKLFVPSDVYMDENFCMRFSMVKTTNFQKPLLPFVSYDSGECCWPGYKNFLRSLGIC